MTGMRAIPVLFTVLLTGCTLNHYTSHGTLATDTGEMSAVLHWKSGDSAITVWRCGALPWPLTQGVTGHDALQTDDGCVQVVIDGSPARLDALRVGVEPLLVVRCEGAIGLGEHPFGPLRSKTQVTWLGVVEPAIPDPCKNP